RVVAGRQQRTELREVRIQQSSGGAAGVGDDAEQAVRADVLPRTDRDLDRVVEAVIQGAGGVRQRAGRDQQFSLRVGGRGVPLEATNSQAEAVGCCENHIFALDLHADTGEHREGVVLTRGDGYLADGLGEEVG